MNRLTLDNQSHGMGDQAAAARGNLNFIPRMQEDYQATNTNIEGFGLLEMFSEKKTNKNQKTNENQRSKKATEKGASYQMSLFDDKKRNMVKKIFKQMDYVNELLPILSKLFSGEEADGDP